MAWAARLGTPALRALAPFRSHGDAAAVAGACARADLAAAKRLVGAMSLDDAAVAALGLGVASPRLAWLAMPEEREAVSLAFHCVASLGPSAAMFRAALAQGRPELATGLLVVGLRADARDAGHSLLHLAARHQAAGLVPLLVALGADPVALDPTLSTPLEVAIDGGDRATVAALWAATGTRVDGAALLERALAASADPALVASFSQAEGLDPLGRARLAVVMGDERALRQVLAAHPEVLGDTSTLGVALVHLAARFGRRALIPILVSAGESPELEVAPHTTWHGRDLSGWTALHLAAFHGHHAAYQVLLGLGARAQVAADGTSPDDLLRFQMFDLGALGAASWASQIHVLPGIARPDKPVVERLPIPSHDRPPMQIRPSFIALGGGVLYDEPPGDELEVWRADVSGGRDELGPADGWETALRQCFGAAERAVAGPSDSAASRRAALQKRDAALAVARGLARRLVFERERSTIGGLEVLATAHLARARIELQARRFAVAEALATRVSGRAVHDARLVVMALARRGQGALGGALAALDELGGEQARWWHWRGLVLGELGRYADAVAALKKASALRPSHVGTRLNLATLLGRAGARAEAKTLAAELVVSVRPSLESAMARLLDGFLRLGDGDLGAREQVEEALGKFQVEAYGHPAIGRVQLGLARLARDGGRHGEARAWLAKARAALVVSDGEDAPILGAIASEESELARRERRLDEALTKGREAYALAAQSEEGELVWPIEHGLARVYRDRARELRRERPDAARGALGVAIALGKRAVDRLKWLRAQAEPIAPEVARAFTEDRIAVWRELARDLADAGRYVEALAVLDALRVDEGRALATRGDGEANVPVLPPERFVVTRGASRHELTALAEAGATRELTPAEEERLKALRMGQREQRRSFEAWLVALEGTLERLPPKRAQAIAALNLRDVSALQGTLARLGPKVAVLHYVFAEDHVRVVVTTAHGQVGREGTLGGDEVMALVMALREQLVDPTSDPRPVARELWSQLIEPIAGDLKAEGADTLFFALDGPLRYLPMAALWDGERWLVERFKVAHLSRAALDKLEGRPRGSDTVGALGAAKSTWPGYAALPAVKEELEAVVKVGDDDPNGVMPGEIRLDEAFTREALMGMLEAKRHTAYHIASHFVLGAREPDSFLLLGDGQRLTLEEIRYDFRFDGVELLALSACNTAVGEERDGRELEGFASLALRLGARQVLATLWPVGDQSTGQLVQNLYRWSSEGNRPRSLALRLAMLGHIRGGAVADEAAPGLMAEPSWPKVGALDGHAHPFYWAPFILIGSWL